MFGRTLLGWKFVIYFLSWLVTLDSVMCLSPETFLGQLQVWRPLTSAIYTESLVFEWFILVLYLGYAGYAREQYRGTLAATLYFFFMCKP